MIMKKLFAFALVVLSTLPINAQKKEPFRAYLFNKEYDVFLRIDFYNESITIPGQELYGQLPGYLGKMHNSFCWVITAVNVNGNTAELQMINDFGSEDLNATLTIENDSLYRLKQVEGSTLKVPKNGKWQKLPKSLVFKRR